MRLTSVFSPRRNFSGCACGAAQPLQAKLFLAGQLYPSERSSDLIRLFVSFMAIRPIFQVCVLSVWLKRHFFVPSLTSDAFPRWDGIWRVSFLILFMDAFPTARGLLKTCLKIFYSIDYAEISFALMCPFQDVVEKTKTRKSKIKFCPLEVRNNHLCTWDSPVKAILPWILQAFMCYFLLQHGETMAN